MTTDGRFFAYPHGMGVTCFVDLDCGPVIRKFNDLAPGDVICTNHPYASEGVATHTPDFQLIKPLFHDGRLVAYGWSFVHLTDVGGRVPSSISPSSTELYQEGLLIPPMRIMRRGEFVSEVVEIFKANVRTPDDNLGDIRAMLSALAVGERRVAEMIGRFGIDTFVRAQPAVIGLSQRKAKAVLRKIPDGEYEFWDYMDDDAVTGIPVRLRVTMTITGGEVALNFAGTDPQTPSPYNIATGGVRHPFLNLRFASFIWSHDPSIALNSGMFDSIRVACEPGSIVHPRFPAPTGIRHATAQRLCDVINGALAKAAPELVPAPCGGVLIPVVFAEPTDSGRQNVLVVEPIVGGMGAFAGHDGVDGRDCSFASLSNNPIESVEAAGNLRIVDFSLRTDSGGPGKWRGGVGLILSIEACCDKALILGRGMERLRFVPWGMQGGRCSPGSRAYVNKGRPDEKELRKIDILELRRGDVVTFETPGGGGYGDPMQRDPEAVLADVQLGLVSAARAQIDYGVVIVDGRIAAEATASHRRKHADDVAGSFDFGSERTAWEAVFPDAEMARINASLAEGGLANKSERRRRLFVEKLPGIAQGSSIAALLETKRSTKRDESAPRKPGQT